MVSAPISGTAFGIIQQERFWQAARPNERDKNIAIVSGQQRGDRWWESAHTQRVNFYSSIKTDHEALQTVHRRLLETFGIEIRAVAQKQVAIRAEAQKLTHLSGTICLNE